MRIFYISTSFIPSRTANSVHVLKQCDALCAEGHSVELVLPSRKKSAEMDLDAVWQSYGLRNQFGIAKVQSAKSWGQMIFPLGAAYHAYYRKAELVYTRSLNVAAATSLFGIPTVYEAHSVPNGRLSSVYFSGLLRGCGFRFIVAISEPLKRLLKERFKRFGLKSEHIYTEPDGVDLAGYDSSLRLLKHEPCWVWTKRNSQ